MARVGIEPTTRGFSAEFGRVQGFMNQSLVALATPLPSLTTAQSRHTQPGFLTFSAPESRDALPAACVGRAASARRCRSRDGCAVRAAALGEHG